MYRGLTLLEDLVAGNPQVERAKLEQSWEFGRLVLDPAWRSGPDLLKRCVFLAVRHLAHTTNGENAFASCTYVLSRLYRRFGFSVVSNNVPVPGADQSYCLIHARIDQVLHNAMAAQAV